jgi:hypothetical protein
MLEVTHAIGSANLVVDLCAHFTEFAVYLLPLAIPVALWDTVGDFFQQLRGRPGRVAIISTSHKSTADDISNLKHNCHCHWTTYSQPEPQADDAVGLT